MDKSVETHLQILKKLAETDGYQLYVVGGTLRDSLLKKPCSDYDFAAPNAHRLAKVFAHQARCPLVPLDNTPGRETYRVVIQKQIYFDFSHMQGKTIEEDLSRRDFTFNAMAIPLQDFLEGKQSFLDPHRGIDDLRSCTVRVLPGPIFPDDPLRVLRAFRFASTLNFTIESDTLAKVAEFKSQLNKVACERIYYELTLFLSAQDTFALLLAMDHSGLLECLLPEIAPLRLKASAWEQALATYKIIENLISQSTTSPELFFGMAESLGDIEYPLLKIAALLHPLKDTAAILKRLRASNSEISFVDQTVRQQEEACNINEFAGTQYDESRIYRFVKQSGKELIPALLLALAVWCAQNKEQETTSNPFALAVLKVYDFYLSKYLPAQEHPALLNGNDLIKLFNISPSPMFKTILEQVEESRVLGKIKTRKEAETMANILINSK